MKILALKKAIVTASVLFAIGYAAITSAHTAGGAIDAAGTNASATDLATVSCYDDGDGATAYLFVQIEDQSAQVPGLLVSIQAYKGTQMTNSSDPVSGDGLAGPGAQLWAGDGTYYISVSKTAAGARLFTITYHCMTSNNIHTGTDIGVLQAQ